MRRPALLALLLLGACHADPPPDRARGFVPITTEDVRRVLFDADGIQPDPADAAGLSAIAAARPTATFLVALPDEGRAEEANAIAERRLAAIRSALLDRPTSAVVGGSRAPRDGEARVTVREGFTGPAACTGPTEPWRRPFVPWFGEASRRALLPVGCASDIALQRQVERPADLVAGRRMSGGPAGPAARAIERYLSRDEEPSPAQAGAPAASGQRGDAVTTNEAPRRPQTPAEGAAPN